jgi:hypothetical protein
VTIWFLQIQSISLNTRIPVPQLPDIACESLGRALFAARDKAEVSLVVVGEGGEVVRAHRQVLVGSSPVFDRMLSSEMREANSDTIILAKTTHSSVLDMLRYMYTRNLSAVQDWPGLLSLASMYSVLDLEDQCVEHMLAILHSEAQARPTLIRITSFMVVAIVHDKPALLKECLSSLASNAARESSSLDRQGLDEWFATLRLAYAVEPGITVSNAATQTTSATPSTGSLTSCAQS